VPGGDNAAQRPGRATCGNTREHARQAGTALTKAAVAKLLTWSGGSARKTVSTAWAGAGRLQLASSTAAARRRPR